VLITELLLLFSETEASNKDVNATFALFGTRNWTHRTIVDLTNFPNQSKFVESFVLEKSSAG
jgi:hypothetical protein